MRNFIFATCLSALFVTGCNSGGTGGTVPPPTPTAATPSFSPEAGAYIAAQTVTLSDSTAGASIRYTTDGSTPTSASSLYSIPVQVSTTMTIEAIAIASGYTNSAVASAVFTITPPAQSLAATPTFSPAAGTYTSAQTVSVADATAGASIYYTTDGSIPTASSTRYTSPVSVAADTTIKAVAIATGYSQSTIATGAYLIAGPAVSTVLSTNDQSNLMAAQAAVTFTTTTAGTNKIIVDESQTYQSIEGFGAAFTDSSAYLLKEVAQPMALSNTMNDLFTRNGSGIGLSFMRNPMGASDLARSVYSFDDLAAGQTDPSLTQFSIAHDQVDILPLIQQARALNPQMKLMASPWSPPGWMKSTGSMIGGTLLPSMYTPFANYFVKYIQAYEAAGVPVDYVSLQNEPLNIPSSYPGMGMNAATQLTVLRDYMLPALAANNLDSKVLVYDHNWDTPSYPDTAFVDPVILASNQVAGTAWHGYGGTPGAQSTVQNLFPTKGAWQTEHSGGTWQSNQFKTDFEEITHVMRNSGKAFVKWGLALDQTLGPHTGGCGTCTPIVTVNSATGAITKGIEYYTLGHYSKYVLPGAKRIYSSNICGAVSVAFLNPDGSKALVAFNDSSTPQTFQVQWGAQAFSYTLLPGAAATFAWNGTQNGAYSVAAKSQIQGSSYNSQSGLETEGTSDTNGGYDLGYVSPDAYAAYKNVDFGSSVTGVSVRVASGGNGGTLEFHLDSPTGTLVSTVTLPVTGGWQNWQTVTGAVSGASGLHDLYAVFRGSGGIANLNWFQFQ
jgi:glucosylceramidase